MNECDIEYPPCEGDEEMEPPLPAGVELRSMEPADLEEVKSLHEQCFPVRYDNAFYENVVHGVIVRGTEGEREPLYTQVAVVPVEDGFESDTPMMTVTRTAQAVRSGISSALNGGHRSGDYADDSEALEEMVIDIDGDHGGTIRQTAIGGANDDNGYEPWPVWSAVNVSLERERTFPESSQTEWVEGVGVTSRRRRKIVGLITCQVIPVKQCRDRDRLGLQGMFSRGLGHSDVVYIMTLGTDTAYRRRGIGRALLRRCVWLSRQEESIGAVYLHVITTNPAAHRFYESEGFVQLCCITDYYSIDGESYDCFLYALFVNGAKRPTDWDWALKGLSRHIRSIVEFFRRTLGQIPEEGRFAAAISSVFGAPGKDKKRQIETDRMASEEGTIDDEQQTHNRHGPQSASLLDPAAYALNRDGIDGIASPAATAVPAVQSQGRVFGLSGSSSSSLKRNCDEIRSSADRHVITTDARGEEVAGVSERVAPSRYGGAMSGITWWDATHSARGGWGKAPMEAHPLGGSGDRNGIGGATVIDVGGYGSVIDVSAQEDDYPYRSNGGTDEI